MIDQLFKIHWTSISYYRTRKFYCLNSKSQIKCVIRPVCLLKVSSESNLFIAIANIQKFQCQKLSISQSFATSFFPQF
jgi:hypothetical protein